MTLKLKILDLNTWLMTEEITPDIFGRLDKLVRLIVDTNPDVILLQEVWGVDYINYLGSKLAGYHISYPKEAVLDLSKAEIRSNMPKNLIDLSPNGIMNCSGLVTLSKAQVSDTQFHPFAKVEGFNPIENFATKGVFVLKVNVSGKDIVIVNTHLYNWNNDRELQTTLSQFQSVFKLAPEGNLFFVGGDFNLGPKRLMPYLPDNFTVDDGTEFTVAREENSQERSLHDKTFATHDEIKFKEDKNNIKVDYIFASKIPGLLVHSEVIKSPVVSDHFPLLVTVSLDTLTP